MGRLIDRNMVKERMPLRARDSHKGTYGRVAVICGSEEMPGAARLVIRGAYQAGAGIVRSFAGKSFAPYLKNDIPEVIVQMVSENLFHTFSENIYEEIGKEVVKYDVTAFGCGVGINEDLEKVLEDLIVGNEKILIIDGDGVSLLGKRKELLRKNKGSIIITPHPKEMSRLTGLSLKEILDNKEKIVSDFCKEYHVHLLLKGSKTIISDSQGHLFINETGNSSLSKGGTGDVLTGIISGFAAQGVSPINSMIIGAYLHGKSGEEASKVFTEYSVRASQVVDFLPIAIKQLEGDA